MRKTTRTDINCKRYDWELLFAFSLAAENMYPNDKKSSVLAMEVEPVTTTDPKFWRWVDHRLDATLGTRQTRSLVTERSGTSQIDQSF